MNVIPGAESLRNPGHPRVFHIRAGDKQQIEKIVHHARTVGTTKMAVLYQDLVVGTSAYAMAEQAAKGAGLQEFKGVKSGTDAAALAGAAEQVKKLEAQTVLVLGAPRFMADGVAALRKAGVSQSLFVLSYVPAGLLVKLAGPEGARGVGIAQTFPNPNGIPARPAVPGGDEGGPSGLELHPSTREGYLVRPRRAGPPSAARGQGRDPASLEKALHNVGEMTSAARGLQQGQRGQHLGGHRRGDRGRQDPVLAVPDQPHPRHPIEMLALHRLAQVALGDARVLAHDGLGPRALPPFDGVEHLPVLVLRDDQHVARPRRVGLHHHEARGRGEGQVHHPVQLA
jgi:hypothetical protein